MEPWTTSKVKLIAAAIVKTKTFTTFWMDGTIEKTLKTRKFQIRAMGLTRTCPNGKVEMERAEEALVRGKVLPLMDR